MYLPAADATKQKKSKKVPRTVQVQVQVRVVVHFCYRRSKVYRWRHEYNRNKKNNNERVICNNKATQYYIEYSVTKILY